MAIHSNILTWRILWTEEPGRLQSMGPTKSQTQLSNTLTRGTSALPSPRIGVRGISLFNVYVLIYFWQHRVLAAALRNFHCRIFF